MAYEKFNVLTSTAVPLPIENVDTDQIIPARFLKATERIGFGDNLFRDWRYNSDGKAIDSFPLNNPNYKPLNLYNLSYYYKKYLIVVLEIWDIQILVPKKKAIYNIRSNRNLDTLLEPLQQGYTSQ